MFSNISIYLKEGDASQVFFSSSSRSLIAGFYLVDRGLRHRLPAGILEFGFILVLLFINHYEEDPQFVS